MELLILIIAAVVVLYWASKAKSSRSSKRPAAVADVPEIKVTITTSFSDGKNRKPPRDVGELEQVAGNAWVLNPKAPLPLTVLGADRLTAQSLKSLLGAAEYWSQKIPDVALIIAQHDLRFEEVDAFVSYHKRGFDSEVEKLIADSAEWRGASEKDREDLRTEFEARALESLGISAGRADFTTLLDGEPLEFSDDDELSRRFGGDAALYSFYLSQLGRSKSAVAVKADDYWRKSWEQLVERGFARRGKDIPAQVLLESLRLKDLNELLAGTVTKPLGRKAKAVEAALALPDLENRLSACISFREMFEALAPAGLDVSGLVRSFSYATAVATVVQQTYFTSVKTLDAIDDHKRAPDMYGAWEVSTWEDPVPPCAAAVCKKYSRLPAKRPPYHVGCTCQLSCVFKG